MCKLLNEYINEVQTQIQPFILITKKEVDQAQIYGHVNH